MNRLLQLLADNRRTERRAFEARATDGDDAELMLYDMIVSDDTEAEWWGGVSPAAFRRALAAVKPEATVHLRINSPGGSVFGGRAIEQALRDHKGKVIAYVDGLAASAATLPLMAADEVVVGAGSMVMIHKAWTVAMGNGDDMRKQADLLDKIDGTLADTYAQRTGNDALRVAQWMAAETWFTADEAVQHRFADRIDGDVQASARASAPVWNLQALLANARQAEPPAASPDHRHRQQQRIASLSRLVPIV